MCENVGKHTLQKLLNIWKVFYYNLAFNDRYLVTPVSMNFSQDLSKNMIWNYSINLKAISPVSFLNIEKEEDTDELIKLSSKKQLLNKTLKRSTGIIKNILAQVNVH